MPLSTLVEEESPFHPVFYVQAFHPLYCFMCRSPSVTFKLRKYPHPNGGKNNPSTPLPPALFGFCYFSILPCWEYFLPSFSPDGSSVFLAAAFTTLARRHDLTEWGRPSHTLLLHDRRLQFFHPEERSSFAEIMFLFLFVIFDLTEPESGRSVLQELLLVSRLCRYRNSFRLFLPCEWPSTPFLFSLLQGGPISNSPPLLV